MKPKFICDGCKKSLKLELDNDGVAWILSDRINGFHLMKHNNLKGYVVICDDCSEGERAKLIVNQMWHDLEGWDYSNPVSFCHFNELKKEISRVPNNFPLL